MDGSGDHALQTHGYTMHFCSGECKGPFESDPDKAILAMNVPGD
jgi:YHS domain-containing protein